MKLFKSSEIFGELGLVHYYWRIELQHRGSPHSHGLYWFSGAPKLEGPDNAEEVTRFFDRFITTSGDDPKIHEVIQYQRHNHSASCLREMRGQQFFRFNMPYPPMPETLVLYPFEENESNVEEYKEIFKKVKELLKSVSEASSTFSFSIK